MTLKEKIKSGRGIIVLSLFDGISCGMVAFEKLGIKIDKYYASEIDESAIAISKKNYKNIIHLGSVTAWRDWDIEQPDIIIGGFPCTGISISQTAYERRLVGTESGLFYELRDIISHYNPEYFLVENNYGIPENVKDEVTRELGVSPKMIDSALVSAQTRKRLYWTNIDDTGIPGQRGLRVYDIIDWCYEHEDLSDEVKWNRKTCPIGCTTLFRIGTIGKGGQGERVYDIEGKSCTLSANGGGRGAKTGLYRIGGVVRKLSSLEAERLQTLPDNYTLIDGISETRRLKAIGNGWTVDVIVHILKGLLI